MVPENFTPFKFHPMSHIPFVCMDNSNIIAQIGINEGFDVVLFAGDLAYPLVKIMRIGISGEY